MSIRVKTILSLLITAIALTVVLYLALWRIVSGGFAAVESDAADRNIDRVRETFASEIEALCAKTSDWSIWDDAYQFVQDRNPEFVQSNIAPSAMSSLNLAALMFFDKSGDVVTSTGYDPENDKLVPVPQRVMSDHFGKKSALIRHAKPDDKLSGLLFAPGFAPLVFCSLPVVPTSGEGEVRGAVVFAKPFDEAAHEALMRTTKLKLAFAEEGGEGFGGPLAPILKKLPNPDSRFVDDADEKLLVGYTRFSDFYGKKGIVARIEMPRDVLEQAQTSFKYMSLALVVFGVVFIVVAVLLVEIAVLRRLAKMSGDVTRITESFDFKSRVDDRSKDELGRLGLCINQMLAAVAQIQHAKGEAVDGGGEPGKGGGHG